MGRLDSRSTRDGGIGLAVESLEDRLLPALGLASFARIGVPATNWNGSAFLSIAVNPDDFQLARGQVLIGFAVSPRAGGAASPGPVGIISDGDGDRTILVRKAATAEDRASLTIASLTPGPFRVRVRDDAITATDREVKCFSRATPMPIFA